MDELNQWLETYQSQPCSGTGCAGTRQAYLQQVTNWRPRPADTTRERWAIVECECGLRNRRFAIAPETLVLVGAKGFVGVTEEELHAYLWVSQVGYVALEMVPPEHRYVLQSLADKGVLVQPGPNERWSDQWEWNPVMLAENRTN